MSAEAAHGTQPAEPPASDDPADWIAWAREAGGERRWASALERWDRCIARFGAKPQWLAHKAHALRRLDRLDEAQALYEALAHDYPLNPSGLDGLAWIAFRRGDLADALTLFTRCIETYPDKTVRAWMKQRALLLLRLGHAAEAEVVYRRLAEEDPADVESRAGYVRARIETCRGAADRAARREELIGYVLANIAPTDAGAALQSLISLGAAADAAALLLHLERDAQSRAEIEACFSFIPRLIERGSRGALWERLLARVREIGNAPVLELRLLLALERFDQFCALVDASRATLETSPHLFTLERVRGRLQKPRREVFAEAKVFGIGLSRTGTTSLAQALTLLGIDTAHWTNPLTHQLLSDGDFFMFGASTDCCVSAEFEKLYYQYPNARFVWTTRPFDAWLASFLGHHDRHSWARDVEGLRRVFDSGACEHMFEHAALEFGLYLNAADLDDAWRAFDSRVRHFFADKPKDKLLKLDLFAGQGWEELCRFLGCPIPSLAFPKLNAAPDREQ
jgi:tetratricopeptide (TPR) repeat protein